MYLFSKICIFNMYKMHVHVFLEYENHLIFLTLFWHSFKIYFSTLLIIVKLAENPYFHNLSKKNSEVLRCIYWSDLVNYAIIFTLERNLKIDKDFNLRFWLDLRYPTQHGYGIIMERSIITLITHVYHLIQVSANCSSNNSQQIDYFL